MMERPTRKEAEKLVHDFQVLREPIYHKVYDIVDGEPTERYELVTDWEMNVRSDTAKRLSIVPVTRVDVQPSEVWDLAELIQGEDKNIKIETAGSYNDGANIWVLIWLDEPVVVNGDPNGLTLPYFCLQNGYVQGEGLRGQATNVRVVCKNTSRLSDVVADSQGTNFSFAHTGNLRERVEGIRDALQGWRQGIQSWKAGKEFMATQRVTTDQINWFVEQFIPAPHHTQISDRVQQNVELDRTQLILELFNSEMNAGITHTALGLFEAASSWNEHVRRAQTPFTRFKRAMLEPSDILEQARELAMAAINA
jgi:phage/plasmid-like protein (TIGR03299 family)